MAEKGISAIHNPMSNLKLGSGIAPVSAMQKAGSTWHWGPTASPPTTAPISLRR